MALLNRFKDYIQSEKLFHPKDRVLLAVSGGVDSVAMCELCRQAGCDFVMAHCNFNLRGEESDRDESFVKGLAEKYNVSLYTKSFDTRLYAKENKQSIETAARELRYQWFTELINDHHEPPLQYILTAHHADDNIETVMMNFFRGTGITGLRGILPRQGKIIRPLLFARRSELEIFVKDNGLAFVTDHTNLQNDYTRNFFRNRILPMVKEQYPEAGNNVIRNVQRFSEIEILYKQSITFHKKKLLEQKANEVHIPVLKLLKTVPMMSVIYEIIKDFDFTAHQAAEVVSLLKSETGKFIRSSSHRIIRNRNWLIISPNQDTKANNILIEAPGRTISFAGGQLKVTEISGNEMQLSTDNNVASLDSTSIQFPLLLRKGRLGDYFYPLGMQKKKKLGRFLSDQKRSMIEKENTWVIESGKKIIWVIGNRIDDRFKVTNSTKNMLRLTYIKMGVR